jgi:pilus assembly protein Flp/PilA
MTAQQPYLDSVTAMQTLARLLADDTGQDLVEYALVMLVMGLGAVSALKGVTTGVTTVFSAVASSLTSAS